MKTKEQKLSTVIIGVFFLFLLLMGTASCEPRSRSGQSLRDRQMQNEGKAQVVNQLQDEHKCFLCTSSYEVDGATTVMKTVVIAKTQLEAQAVSKELLLTAITNLNVTKINSDVEELFHVIKYSNQ
jgi:hypothetical protein